MANGNKSIWRNGVMKAAESERNMWHHHVISVMANIIMASVISIISSMCNIISNGSILSNGVMAIHQRNQWRLRGGVAM
jgi:hypothetical protein